MPEKRRIASTKISPKSRSFRSPTPLMVENWCRSSGLAAAIWRRETSGNTTYGGTPLSSAISFRNCRSFWNKSSSASEIGLEAAAGMDGPFRGLAGLEGALIDLLRVGLAGVSSAAAGTGSGNWVALGRVSSSGLPAFSQSRPCCVRWTVDSSSDDCPTSPRRMSSRPMICHSFRENSRPIPCVERRSCPNLSILAVRAPVSTSIT